PAQDHILFWDTIQLGAKHAWWYYDTGFSRFLLPDELDSGHPPFFGMLLAAVWKLAGGPNLVASHWMMFPFLTGIIYQLFTLTAKFPSFHPSQPQAKAPSHPLSSVEAFGGGGLTPSLPHPLSSSAAAFGAGGLFLLDPVLLGQSILITPDIPLVFFFLLGLNAIENKRKTWLTFAVAGLALISMRGMMTAAGLYLYALLTGWDRDRKWWLQGLKTALPFIPGGLAALAFLVYHYQVKGWIGYHPDSPWAPGFERVDFRGLLKNIAVAGWRWLDFGRIFLWLGLAFLLWRGGWKTFRDPVVKKAFTLVGVLSFTLSISFLSYSGLQAHRYLLPAFLSFTLFFLTVINRSAISPKIKTGVFLVVLTGLATGNCWIYTDKVSQGWDSTLAQWPYCDLRDEMLDRMEAAGIPLDRVGTAFPEIGPLKFRDLSDRTDGMVEKDLERQNWILYSNVMNDFSDAETDILAADWIKWLELKDNGVKFILYKRPE
ncbi:MAG TPA: hypothetical protein PKB07_17990, partial [Flavilitoribacter sp.]|nr:hypothetical protein [Flavilitoribacter sp.]